MPAQTVKAFQAKGAHELAEEITKFMKWQDEKVRVSSIAMTEQGPANLQGWYSALVVFENLDE